MVMRRRMGFLSFFVYRGFRLIMPLLLGAVVLVIKLILTAVVSLIVGIPEATHKVAKELEDLVMQSGKLPSAYARAFYWVVRILAVIVVLVGWICFSFTTVFLVTAIVQ